MGHFVTAGNSPLAPWLGHWEVPDPPEMLFSHRTECCLVTCGPFEVFSEEAQMNIDKILAKQCRQLTPWSPSASDVAGDLPVLGATSHPSGGVNVETYW